jgi:hypothetical protein
MVRIVLALIFLFVIVIGTITPPDLERYGAMLFGRGGATQALRAKCKANPAAAVCRRLKPPAHKYFQ